MGKGGGEMTEEEASCVQDFAVLLTLVGEMREFD